MRLSSVGMAALGLLVVGVACEQHSLPPNPQAVPPTTVKPAVDTRSQGPYSGGGMMGGGEAGGDTHDVGPAVRGKIEVSPELQAKIPQEGVLFVIARSAAMEKGPPLAVFRSDVLKFPINFELSQANVMITGLEFQGPLNIIARLDQDGNAMSKDTGDLLGATSAPVSVPSEGVVITLNSVQE